MKLTKDLIDFFGKLHSLPEGTNIEIKENVIIFEPKQLDNTEIEFDYICPACNAKLLQKQLVPDYRFSEIIFYCFQCGSKVK